MRRHRNVFWVVGSSATLGTNSALQGNVLALTSITVTADTTIDGRALAINGAVTLDTNTITAPNPSPSPVADDHQDSGHPPRGPRRHRALHDHRRLTPARPPYTGATLTDSLTGVLGDATYDDDATATAGAVSFTSPDLTWTGDLRHRRDGDRHLFRSPSIAPLPATSFSPTPLARIRRAATARREVLIRSAASPWPSSPACCRSPHQGSADLGTAAPGRTASARLGTVQVTDGRAGLAVGWTATVSSTDFTTGGGKAAADHSRRRHPTTRSAVSPATTGSATLTQTPGTNYVHRDRKPSSPSYRRTRGQLRHLEPVDPGGGAERSGRWYLLSDHHPLGVLRQIRSMIGGGPRRQPDG